MIKVNKVEELCENLRIILFMDELDDVVLKMGDSKLKKVTQVSGVSDAD